MGILKILICSLRKKIFFFFKRENVLTNKSELTTKNKLCSSRNSLKETDEFKLKLTVNKERDKKIETLMTFLPKANAIPLVHTCS